ncbi:MAG: hypothetical protein K8S00_06045 [Bacteroidales bacterium]|nr:hypothetical protein [Bacteroidales bacterium]
MSQITETRIDGIVVTRRVITDTCKKIWTAANEVIARLNDNAETAKKIKRLEKQLRTQNKTKEVSFEEIKKQVSNVREAIDSTTFIKLSTRETTLLKDALVLKHTDIKDHVSFSDAKSIMKHEPTTKKELKWDPILTKVKDRLLQSQMDHAVKAFSEVCKSLHYIEVDKQTSSDGESHVKATNKVGQAATMIINPDKKGLHCKIDLAGFNPDTKDCQVIQRKIISGLRKHGVILSEIKLFTHNNPEGIIRLKEKSKITKIVDFVAGKIRKNTHENTRTYQSHQNIKN